MPAFGLAGEHAQPLLASLQAGGRVRLCLLSNYSRWYELVDAELGLARFFAPGDTFVSYRTGHRKPAPAAFHAVLDALQVAPEQCVLVDDRPANCEAAQALGMRSIVFEDTPTLIAALTAMVPPAASL